MYRGCGCGPEPGNGNKGRSWEGATCASAVVITRVRVMRGRTRVYSMHHTREHTAAVIPLSYIPTCACQTDPDSSEQKAARNTVTSTLISRAYMRQLKKIREPAGFILSRANVIAGAYPLSLVYGYFLALLRVRRSNFSCAALATWRRISFHS